jgi:hypothetical protein
MKDEILKRGMFAQPLSKSSKNSGIMAGFEDEMEEEEIQPMARSPQNPEILMNNLRGDMRSVDARYLELAQMVGDEAAMDTPPEVLAMLQSQFAAQAAPPVPQGGIGALPQGAEMAPPPMMMGQEQGMPPGMEGMPPFPQGGAEQAPPTPDGMPPLRAADGAFVTQGARQDPFAPFQVPERFNELMSGQIPEEQMTPNERSWVKSYKSGMGFTGGGIRDVASQGMGRIGSALAPYAQRGADMLRRGLTAADEFAGGFLPPNFKVTPMMTPAGNRRAMVQGGENIKLDAQGRPIFGTQGLGGDRFSRLEQANTLGISRAPLSENLAPLGRKIAEISGKKVNPGVSIATALAATGMARRDPSAPRSAEELAQVNALINQIPGPNTPLRDGRPAVDGPSTSERPEDATISRINAQGDEVVPFETPFNRPVKDTDEIIRSKMAPVTTRKFIDQTIEAQKEEKKEKPLTRAERIKAEYAETEPLFREILGSTKSTARTNALLLLADAGFKFASTYKPTMAMALGSAMADVPRGFASIVAQAKDSDIKIKTAALQQAVSNIDVQDKVARDVMLRRMQDGARYNQLIFQAGEKKELEKLKAQFKKEEIITKGDIDRLLKLMDYGIPEVEDIGGGIQIRRWKNGETYTSLDKNSDIPTKALGSSYTITPTDSPYVELRGPSSMLPVRDKEGVKKALNAIGSHDSTLRDLDSLRTEVQNAFGPGTWTKDTYNRLVPLTFNTLTPIVEVEALKTKIKVMGERISKSIAAAGQDGRLSNQDVEFAREPIRNLLEPTAFLSNPELAATTLSSLDTMVRNSRQGEIERLGYEKNEYRLSTPATGSKSNPFVYGSDPQQAYRMDLYLKNLYRGQNPNTVVYINANGQTMQTTIGNILSAPTQ